MILSLKILKRTLLRRILESTLSLKGIKRTLSMGTLRRTLSQRTLRRTLNRNLSLRSLERNLLPTKNSSFLALLCNGVDDWHKFSYKNYSLARPRFYTAVNCKLELKNFSRKR